MEAPVESRRSALRTIALFLVGGAGLWRFLTPRPTAVSESAVAAARLDEVPSDGALVLPELGVALVRRGASVWALDLACTHLGCTVTATSEGFTCPCHGSRFDPAGAPLAGPAARELRRVAVVVDNGVVRVPRRKHAARGGERGPCCES